MADREQAWQQGGRLRSRPGAVEAVWRHQDQRRNREPDRRNTDDRRCGHDRRDGNGQAEGPSLAGPAAAQTGRTANGTTNSDHHERYEDEVELLDYVEVIVHRRWLVVCGTLLCALVAGLTALQKPQVYQAQAVLLPDQRPDYARLGPDVEIAGRQSAGRHVNMLESIPIRRAVLARQFDYEVDGEPVTTTLMAYFGAESWQAAIGALEGAVDVSAEKAGSISVVARLPSAALAAAVPNALVRELISDDQERRTRYVEEQVAFIEQRVSEVQTELADAEQALAEFRRRNRDLALAESGQAFVNSDLVVEHSRLQREVSIRSSLLSTLLNQREVARLEAKKEPPGVEVLAWAERPQLPEGRGSRKYVLLGGIVGLMACVMLAFLLEYGKRSAEAGRLEPILDDLSADAQRLRRFFGRSRPIPES